MEYEVVFMSADTSIMYGMLKRSTWRVLLAIAILVITAVVFTDYFVTHPAVADQLSRTSIITLLILFSLYAAFVGSLSLINSAALRLCRSRIRRRESLLLTMYSSIINFFGPLQSGPAFRALYLKQKHGVALRDYTLASFVYYFFYALFSVALLVSAWLKWWLLPLIALAVLAVYLASQVKVSTVKGLKRLDLGQWHFMALASLLQVGILFMIFFVELKTVIPDVELWQAAVYTGAANLALFVSLTPGAIGFRESFLLFSQNLHEISSTAIVSANILDRAVYVLMLLGLAAVIFGTHARRYLKSGLKE